MTKAMREPSGRRAHQGSARRRPRDPAVVIPVHNGTLMHHILRTDLTDQLRRRGLHPIVLCPVRDHPLFQQEFSSLNVQVEQSRPYPLGFVQRRLDELRHVSFRNRNRIRSLETREGVYWLTHPGVSLWRGPARAFMAPLGLFYRALDELLLATAPSDWYDALFARYRPALFVSTHPYRAVELPLLRACRRWRVPAVAMISAWDHITNQGPLPCAFERVMVWSEFLKQRVLEYYDDYAPDQVVVTGVPQLDTYAHTDRFPPRGQFLRSLGLDPAAKLITYTTSSQQIHDAEHEVIEELSYAIRAGRIPQPVQLYVRLHPKDRLCNYAHMAELPGVKIESPGEGCDVFDDGWNPQSHDMDHLAHLLHHTDVLVNATSTVGILSIALDKPAIYVGFHGRQQRPYLRHVRRYYDYTHLADVARSDAIPVVWTTDALVHHINRYLADPSLDRDKRERVVREQCFRVDGQATARIAQTVADFVAERAARARGRLSRRT